MSDLPIIHKTKLNKDQTYFVHAPDLEKLLSRCAVYNQLCLNFSDDPSQYKSNYDRFIKQEGKMVILSVRYTPPPDDAPEADAQPADSHPYRLTVYATVKALREDLIEQFEIDHFATLLEWLNEPRDRIWLQSPHAIQFLIDVEKEEVEVAYDIDFDSYARHNHKHKFRTDIRRH
ncbi:MAG: hypothetical protein JXX14_04395 [Deltaproteobacteria bacterium]|nr:hypothetical protein [Deltaproteobacteria bacterium]